jgi:hypothetical protein
MIEDSNLKYYENIISFLEKNYNSKLQELNRYSKWLKPIQRITIKRQLNDIQNDVMYYHKLIIEYKKRGFL